MSPLPTSSFIVAVLNTAKYPNRKVYVCGTANSTFYAPEFGAFFTLFQKKARRYRSRERAEKWLAERPRAHGQIYVET